jgi:hypothetical protein
METLNATTAHDTFDKNNKDHYENRNLENMIYVKLLKIF